MVRFRFLFWPAYVFYHPDHVKRVLQENHRNQLVGFGRLMSESTVAMLQRWQHTAPGDAPLDIPLEMMRLTLRIAGLALFSLDLSNEAGTVGCTFTTLGPLIFKYLTLPFPPLWVPTPRNRRLQVGLNTLNKRYSLRLVPGHPVEPQVRLSLRPRYGLPMTLQQASFSV